MKKLLVNWKFITPLLFILGAAAFALCAVAFFKHVAYIYSNLSDWDRPELTDGFANTLVFSQGQTNAFITFVLAIVGFVISGLVILVSISNFLLSRFISFDDSSLLDTVYWRSKVFGGNLSFIFLSLAALACGVVALIMAISAPTRSLYDFLVIKSDVDYYFAHNFAVPNLTNSMAATVHRMQVFATDNGNKAAADFSAMLILYLASKKAAVLNEIIANPDHPIENPEQLLKALTVYQDIFNNNITNNLNQQVNNIEAAVKSFGAVLNLGPLGTANSVIDSVLLRYTVPNSNYDKGAFTQNFMQLIVQLFQNLSAGKTVVV